MGKKVILTVIGLSFLLKFTTSEGSCEPPRRGMYLYYNVTTNPDFRLWLKMEEKNTNLKTSLLLDSGTAPVPKFQMFVWSNTDVYKGFSNKLIKTEFGITGKNISHVTIGANASMEWIYCTNSFTFPAPNNPNASSVPASDNKVMTVVVVVVVVLVMVLLVVVVMLAAAGAYIHRLRNNLNQLVASQFKSKTEDNSKHNGVHLPKCDRQVYPAAAPPSPRSGAPLPDGLQENIYEEWQERPAVAAASHHSSTNSIYGLVVNLPQEHKP